MNNRFYLAKSAKGDVWMLKDSLRAGVILLTTPFYNFELIDLACAALNDACNACEADY